MRNVMHADCVEVCDGDTLYGYVIHFSGYWYAYERNLAGNLIVGRTCYETRDEALQYLGVAAACRYAGGYRMNTKDGIYLAAQLATWSNDPELEDEHATLLKDAATCLRSQYDELHKLTARRIEQRGDQHGTRGNCGADGEVPKGR